MKILNRILNASVLTIGIMACERSNEDQRPEPPNPNEPLFAISLQLVDQNYQVLHEDINEFYADSLNDYRPPFFTNNLNDTVLLQPGKNRELNRKFGLVFIAFQHQDTLLKNMYRLPDSLMTWVLHWNSKTNDILKFGPPVGTEYNEFTGLTECRFTLLNGDTIFIPFEYPEPDSSFTISPTLKIRYP